MYRNNFVSDGTDVTHLFAKEIKKKIAAKILHFKKVQYYLEFKV
jgi:hypothetical protein